MILFDRVSFRYTENKETSFELREVSFSWQKKKLYGLIGENGSGKSTCARLIAGLLLPVEGKIEVCGIDTSSEDADLHCKVGIIFQNPDNQIVGTTVEEDIAFGLENLALSPMVMHDRIEKTAKELNISQLLKTPIHKLSGGQKQLVCIASVLVMEPEWIIFDEPTSHLDPWARRELWRLLLRLKKERDVGIIVISQISDDFDNFDEVIIFNSGRIKFNGTCQKLKECDEAEKLIRMPDKWIFEKLVSEHG